MGNLHFFRQASAGIALIALSQGIFGQPLVNAGDDQLGVVLTTARSGSIRLMGEADPYDSLRWVQLSGPHAVINEPGSSISLVTLPDTGAYLFVLRIVFQGGTFTDSVTITVRPDQPFIVLAPVANAAVPSGKPYTIRWTMDPSIPCLVWYSVDNGLTPIVINTGGGATDSIVWNVPDDLVPGTNGIIIVKDYETKKQVAQGTFVVTSTAARMSLDRRRGRNMVVGLNKAGDVRVAFTGGVPASLTIVDISGKCIFSNLSRTVAPRANAPSVLLYQITDRNGLAYHGRVRDSR